MPRTWLILLMVLVSACGSGAATVAPITDPAVAPSIEVPATTTTGTPGFPDSTTTTTTPDLAVFIAALAAALADTTYEGTPLSDPEVYIATGQLFCERLSAGSTPENVLAGYLNILTEGEIGNATADQVSLAGVLLGVSVEVLCPEEIDALP
ncbi:MAG: DUF732 domain-containing protein [Acidimicrobiia bacterium]|nr:DUF732 domain-containing protein [Acidimicrobiia bacterium]